MLKLMPVLLSLAIVGCGLDPCSADGQLLSTILPVIGNGIDAAVCAAEGSQMAKVGDIDGDGVPDSADECPFTPQGPVPNPQRPGCPLPMMAPLSFASPLAAGFSPVMGVSWQSTAGWDAKASVPTVSALIFSAPVDPALQHTLVLQVSAAVDLNSGADIVDCAPPAQDYVNGHCIKRSLAVQVLAGDAVLYDAELTQTSTGWAPMLPQITLPVGSAQLVVKYSAIGSVLLTPAELAGQDTAAAVR